MKTPKRKPSHSASPARVFFLGLACLATAATRLHAQAMYGSSYGPTGTYNFYGGVGPYGWGAWGYGVTGYGVGPQPPPMPYPQTQAQVQQQLAYSTRYNVNTARQNQAALAANRFRQQALSAASRVRDSGGVPKFDVKRRAPDAPTEPTGEAARADLASRIGSVIDKSGQVLWPVPLDDVLSPDLLMARERAETAIRDGYQEWVGGGRSTLDGIVQARQALRLYGQPALTALDLQADTIRYDRLQRHLTELDHVLQEMTLTDLPPRPVSPPSNP